MKNNKSDSLKYNNARKLVTGLLATGKAFAVLGQMTSVVGNTISDLAASPRVKELVDLTEVADKVGPEAKAQGKAQAAVYYPKPDESTQDDKDGTKGA